MGNVAAPAFVAPLPWPRGSSLGSGPGWSGGALRAPLGSVCGLGWVGAAHRLCGMCVRGDRYRLGHQWVVPRFTRSCCIGCVLSAFANPGGGGWRAQVPACNASHAFALFVDVLGLSRGLRYLHARPFALRVGCWACAGASLQLSDLRKWWAILSSGLAAVGWLNVQSGLSKRFAVGLCPPLAGPLRVCRDLRGGGRELSRCDRGY